MSRTKDAAIDRANAATDASKTIRDFTIREDALRREALVWGVDLEQPRFSSWQFWVGDAQIYLNELKNAVDQAREAKVAKMKAAFPAKLAAHVAMTKASSTKEKELEPKTTKKWVVLRHFEQRVELDVPTGLSYDDERRYLDRRLGVLSESSAALVWIGTTVTDEDGEEVVSISL